MTENIPFLIKLFFKEKIVNKLLCAICLIYEVTVYCTGT